MAQNITLMGANYSDVPSVLLPKTGGGQARFIDAEAWSWLGIEPKYLDTPYSNSVALNDTDWVGWTASTTAKTIKASSSVGTFVADMENKAYALRWRWQIQVKSLSGVTNKALPLYQCGEIWQLIFRRPNSLANIRASSFVGNATVATRSVPLIEYYSSGGSRTYSYTGSYGFYASSTLPTFSDATVARPTVTIKTPTLNARCSTTYFTSARNAYIDGTSHFDYIVMRYELPWECAEVQMHRGLVDLYNNPLVITSAED